MTLVRDLMHWKLFNILFSMSYTLKIWSSHQDNSSRKKSLISLNLNTIMKVISSNKNCYLIGCLTIGCLMWIAYIKSEPKCLGVIQNKVKNNNSNNSNIRARVLKKGQGSVKRKKLQAVLMLNMDNKRKLIKVNPQRSLHDCNSQEGWWCKIKETHHRVWNKATLAIHNQAAKHHRLKRPKNEQIWYKSMT